MDSNINNLRLWKRFFEFLNASDAIHIVWKSVLGFIDNEIQDPDKDDVLFILCIYFSFLDDGNTCILLDKNKLLDKWNKKWQKLFDRSNEVENNQANDCKREFGVSTFLQNSNTDLVKAVENGINKLLELKKDTDNRQSGNMVDVINSFFTIKESTKDKKNWLFAKKYFNAISKINECLEGSLFDNIDNIVSDKEICGIKNKFRKYTGLDLNYQQCKCILNGEMGKNFIITGGPGTGKTTVVTYMLWNIFEKNEEFLEWELKFAAPSGKAAKRIKESISDELENFCDAQTKEKLKDDTIKDEIVFKDKTLNDGKEKYLKIYHKLKNAEALTIHKLLNIDSRGYFRYNAQNTFEKRTILVIDEASMIDICLFSSIFKAIPIFNSQDTDKFRLFILGDEKQLPSVDNGAVLGNILSCKKDKVITLLESNRFKDESMVGRFAKKIQNENNNEFMITYDIISDSPDKFDYIRLKDEDRFKSTFDNVSIKDDYPVITYFPKNIVFKKLRETVKKIVEKWAEVYYKRIVDAAKLSDNILDTSITSGQNEFFNNLKKLNNEAQILCAGRQGILGCDNINMIVEDYIVKQNKLSKYGPFFPGKKVIITENLSDLNLSNGDTGIVVQIKNNANTSDLKVKFDSLDDLIPIADIPLKSMQSSYAITIHKSQGSGFKSILVLLPYNQNHPLLTRQILYTAITRTKGSTYIFASDSCIKTACLNNELRDTGLECVSV